MRKIDNIIVHCSDSSWGCAREIRKWHTNPPPKGKGWDDIAYHFVIGNGRPTFEHHENLVVIPRMDGNIEYGRYLDDDKFIEQIEVGAHTLGFNAKSIGICLIGHYDFTKAQMTSLYGLLDDLCIIYSIPVDNILGHYETENGKSQGKTCPNLDMAVLRQVMHTM